MGLAFANSENSAISRLSDGAVIPAISGNADYDAILASGVSVAPYVPPVPTAQTYAAAIEDHIDSVAKSRGYASGERMASYATDPAFAFEAQPFVIWRGQVWVYANTELAKVQAGQRTAPTVAGFLAELPAITWP